MFTFIINRLFSYNYQEQPTFLHLCLLIIICNFQPLFMILNIDFFNFRYANYKFISLLFPFNLFN